MATAMIKCIGNDLNGFIDTIDNMEEFNKYVQGLFGIKFAQLLANDEELKKDIDKNSEVAAVLELLKIFSGGNI